MILPRALLGLLNRMVNPSILLITIDIMQAIIVLMLLGLCSSLFPEDSSEGMVEMPEVVYEVGRQVDRLPLELLLLTCLAAIIFYPRRTNAARRLRLKESLLNKR